MKNISTLQRTLYFNDLHYKTWLPKLCLNSLYVHAFHRTVNKYLSSAKNSTRGGKNTKISKDCVKHIQHLGIG